LGSFRQIRARDRSRSRDIALDELPEGLVAVRARLALVAVELQQVRQACDERSGGQDRRRRRLVRARGDSGRLDLLAGEAKGRGLSRAHPAQLGLGDGGGSSAPAGGDRAGAEPARPRFDDRQRRVIGFDRRIQPVPQGVPRRPRLAGGGPGASAPPRVRAVGLNLRLRGHRMARPSLSPGPAGRRASEP
jgi:hypothetical protein